MTCSTTTRILCGTKNCNVCFNRSLASSDKATKLWNAELNNNINPLVIFKNSHVKYWFTCDKKECGHNFEIGLNALNGGGSCQYCVNKLLCDCNICFEKSFASCKFSKYMTGIEDIEPKKLFLGSPAKFEFKCEICCHLFDAPLTHMSRADKFPCPFCTNHRLCDSKNCKLCNAKSFASSAKAKYWDYKKNVLCPWQVFLNSGNKYWFNCNTCDHSIEIRLGHVSGSESWCIYCAKLKLCDSADCKFCFEQSFASHPKIIYWSKNNDENILPRQIFKHTNLKCKFDCNICGHEFIQIISCVTRKEESWCQYCSHKQLCKNLDCDFCHNNSFASHPMAVHLHPDNKIDPRFVFKKTNTKLKFICDVITCKNIFETTVGNISVNNQGCPQCVNKTEKQLFDWFNANYKELLVKHNIKFNWCRSETTNNHYPFDFVIEDYKLIIELDGEHHFKTVKRFRTTSEENQIRDVYKMKKANTNGYTVIRVIQMDVYFNKNNWDTKLKDVIKQYDNPTCVFIDTNPKFNYNELKEKMYKT